MKKLLRIAPAAAVMIAAHQEFMAAKSLEQLGFKAIRAWPYANNSPFREVWP